MIADDSGLEVDALQGRPGVRSARYAADQHNVPEHAPNSDDEANNARLLRELHDVPEEFRTGRFVCVIAVARNGHTLATFHGKAEGIILHASTGNKRLRLRPVVLFSPDREDFCGTRPPKKRPNTAIAAQRSANSWIGPTTCETLHPHNARVMIVTRFAIRLRYSE